MSFKEDSQNSEFIKIQTSNKFEYSADTIQIACTSMKNKKNYWYSTCQLSYVRIWLLNEGNKNCGKLTGAIIPHIQTKRHHYKVKKTRHNNKRVYSQFI